jgi:hypothetical protein
VPYLKDPKLTDIVERDISLTAGRTARIRGGLLAEPSKLWGVHVGFQHRIIMPKDRIGCSDYGGISQMFARVQLSGPWHLGKFKDQLVDEDERDELESALELVLEPILEKCNSASLDTKIAELGELINEGLPESIAAARPHRRKPKTDVTAKTKQKKKSNGRVERDKADLGKGPAKTKQPQSGRLLILLEGKNDENGVGLYKPGRPDCVYLSPDNPAIDKFVQLRDQQHAADALRLIGIMMYVEGKFQRDLLRSYGRHVADLMSLNVATSRDEKLL